ncbi:MAG: TraB/GumN family protein [Desulfobacterales bacterium]|jgi:pheromone shutdown-related protein TraB|nr:TraB/GumN family protein [Desulfobacterales bacterium]
MEPNNNQEAVHRLTYESKEIVLIGTAHVSRESARLVQELIAEEQPDTVCVELCDSRYQTIRQSEQWRDTDIIKIIKEKKAFLLLSNLLLSSFQKRIAEKLDVRPGQEMITAIESAEAVGADIHLADREIRVTLARTWRLMSLWDKLKLMFQLVLSLGEIEDISEEDVEKMKQQDVLESLLSELGQSMPVLRNILIDERDQYLAEKIRTAPGKRIIAVVGAGHVPGIKQYWHAKIDLAVLETLPPKGKWFGFAKWLIPMAVVALIVYGFYKGGAAAGTEMIVWWILANAVLAGAGALVALGHPLTILSSMVAAPITSLNPMIAAGWVSGLVEAFSRKPKVRDLENLSEDILSVRGFWRNKVTRILLVVVFTNLGSTLGTFVAMPFLVKIL